MENRLSFSAEFANLIFLTVLLNGRPATAMFDTGAGMTVMPRRTAEAVGLEWDGGRRRGGNNTGGRLALETGVVQSVQVGTMELKNWTVGVVEDSAFDMVGRDDGGRPFPAELFLGWDVISRFCWAFDMEQRRATVSAGGTMPKAAGLTWDRFPILRVEVEGAEYPIGFDCGHTETMLDNSWRTRFEGLQVVTTTTVGLGDALQETALLVPRLELRISGAGVRLRDVEILDRAIPGARPGSLTGLLGADILEGRSWAIDAESRYFRLDGPTGEIPDH